MVDKEEPIRIDVLVPIAQTEAFRLFAEGFDAWWPREYTWSQQALEGIGLEPRAGGRCTERGPKGFRCDWGRVLEWSPPARLVLSWQIGAQRQPQPNPEHASTIEVVFRPEGSRATRVCVEHRELWRHGEGAAGYRAAMASEQGWKFILQRYAQAAGRDKACAAAPDSGEGASPAPSAEEREEAGKPGATARTRPPAKGG
jgi:uncharacterized protein YndB with AHSA1/START domain